MIGQDTLAGLQEKIESNTPAKTRWNTTPKSKDPTTSLGSMPQEVYSKQEYCSDSMLYLIVPKHKVAIPYGSEVTPKLVETLATTLLDHSDVQSSQTPTDYPIVTHVQLEMHYSDYTMVEQLKVIPVYKPRKALSGWEERAKTATRRAHLDSVKYMKEKELARLDPFEGGEDIPTTPASYSITPDRQAEIAKDGR
jgi:hypothetical protein